MNISISRLRIEGFRRFKTFDLELNSKFNVIVGDNETGKSSLLKAIGLVLTGQYEGRLIQYALDPYLFNANIVSDYFAKRRQGQQTPPPHILIEAYFDGTQGVPELAKLRGSHNSRGEDCPGLVIAIEVDADHVESLKEYAANESNPAVLPIEFFRVTWRSFSGNGVSVRLLPFRAATIDTSLGRSYRGPTKYLSQVATEILGEDQRQGLSLEYKRLQHSFTQEPAVRAINEYLATQGNPATRKRLSIQMDMSSRSSWDSVMTAYLDDLPFECAGKGEQSRIHLRLAIAGAERSQVILIEEPENHLSHSNLNMLMDDIARDCIERQVIIATHSAYVLNKLGVDNLILLSHDGHSARLDGLAKATRDYFMKLPGYDTLRLILSRRCILVEGPSDELIVQCAYRRKHGRLPLEDGVDVISVGSLAFSRFLEIAELLRIDVRVVTDNDGDVSAVQTKYTSFLEDAATTIRICYDNDESYPTLEPQLLKANSLAVLNQILGIEHACEDDLLQYMSRHKTDCALKMFEAKEEWATPEYIQNAIT